MKCCHGDEVIWLRDGTLPVFLVKGLHGHRNVNRRVRLAVE